jgi:N-acetylmuramoyl-L-alanine amidase
VEEIGVLNKSKWFWTGLLVFTFLISSIYSIKGDVKAFDKSVLHLGSRGNDVKELQGRLAYVGLFKGQATGVFGYKTYLAVRKLQAKRHIRIDGKAGKQTKFILTQLSKKWRAPRGFYVKAAAPKSVVRIQSNRLGFSDADIQLMANAVHGESRGEPYLGQVAVAAVILNRMENTRFPKTPAGVIFQPGAFTAVADGQIFLTPNATSKKAVLDAIHGWDPTGGCIYYFNPRTATNRWIWSRPQMITIGKHIFCM